MSLEKYKKSYVFRSGTVPRWVVQPWGVEKDGLLKVFKRYRRNGLNHNPAAIVKTILIPLE